MSQYDALLAAYEAKVLRDTLVIHGSVLAASSILEISTHKFYRRCRALGVSTQAVLREADAPPPELAVGDDYAIPDFDR